MVYQIRVHIDEAKHVCSDEQLKKNLMQEIAGIAIMVYITQKSDLSKIFHDINVSLGM